MSSKEKQPQLMALHSSLVDLVMDGGELRYLVRAEDGLEIRAAIEEAGQTFVPPPIGKLPMRGTFVEGREVQAAYASLSSGEAAFIESLYQDLREYLRSLSELPDERYYDLLTTWIFHTYIHERFAYTPVIVLFAVAERGKSRTGKGLMFVAYRGLTINSLRDSFIFRMAEHLGVTMFLDISQFQSVLKLSGCEDILLNRFERDSLVPRVNNPERGAFRDLDYYQVYGPTVLGTNQALNHTLGTRAITIVMPQSNREFPDPVTAETSADLRVRLLAFRAWAMQQQLPVVTKPAHGRLGDILKPLVQTARLLGGMHEDAILELAKRIDEERMEDKSQTREAEALTALLACHSQVANDRVALDVVRELFNARRELERQLSAASFAQLLRSTGLKLGGRHYRTNEGRSAIPWDSENIQGVCRDYGIEPNPTPSPEAPEPPATP